MKQSLKTFIIAAAILAAPAVNSFAASLDNIFGEFESVENVQVVKIPRIAMWVANVFGAFDEYKAVGKNIKGIKVMNLSDAGNATLTKFGKRFNDLSKGLETMVAVNDGDSKVKILSEVKGDKFNNIYIYAISDGTTALVKLSGTFTADDIAALEEDAKKNNKE